MERNHLHDSIPSNLGAVVPLFGPWLLAEVISYNPIASYGVAWLATFFIFCYSIKGPLQATCTDLPLRSQVMRPLILVQLIFAGLMSGTSIFYFLNHLGFYFLTDLQLNTFRISEDTYQLAFCQRLYLLAHASLVLGMILVLKPARRYGYAFIEHADKYLITALVLTIIAAHGLLQVSALAQFGVILLPVPKFLAALILVKGLRSNQHHYTLIGAGFLLFSLYLSSLSGYKEGIFIHFIILAFVLYPYYKTVILGLALPVMFALIYLLPTWNNVLRSSSWQGDQTAENAAEIAFNQVFDDDNQEIVQQNSWDFLTNRFTEIGMFSKYVNHVPSSRPFYGTEIIKDAFYALIPRFLWADKPNTEEASMQRVYEAEVVSQYSDASAKTRTVVDGYLSAGTSGVLITMIIYGIVCQWLCNLAEHLFGGYQIGCLVVFNGMFQQLWRGNNFEFILNNAIYGLVLMMFTFFILKSLGLLKQNQP